MTIRVEIDDDEAQAALGRLVRAGADLSPFMRSAAGHLEDSVRESFRRQASPAGPWAPLKPSTLRERQRRGYRPGPILQRSGALKRSVTSESDATSATAGTNLRYASTHQFGASAGEYGVRLGRRGSGPIPWGDVPARPFLVLWPEHKTEIVDSLQDHLKRVWRGAA